MRYGYELSLAGSSRRTGNTSKMFCACRWLILLGKAQYVSMPGLRGMQVSSGSQTKAVEFAIRVALALECGWKQTSLFARKNYFY